MSGDDALIVDVAAVVNMLKPGTVKTLDTYGQDEFLRSAKTTAIYNVMMIKQHKDINNLSLCLYVSLYIVGMLLDVYLLWVNMCSIFSIPKCCIDTS